MCGCEPGWTCSRCKGTRHDPRYLDDEPKTRQEEADERRNDHADTVVLPGLRA